MLTESTAIKVVLDAPLPGDFTHQEPFRLVNY